MTGLDLLLLTLAAFRLTHLVVVDSITEPVRDRVKARSAFFGELVTCYWCCGVWVSGLVAAAWFWLWRWQGSRFLVLLLALAGAQALIETGAQAMKGKEKVPVQSHREDD